VRRFVDGKLDAGGTVVVPSGAWILPMKTQLLDTGLPELWLGKGGAIWLARCTATRQTDLLEVCTARSWVRIDGGPTGVRKAPGGVRRASSAVPGLGLGGKLPKGVKAPAGWTVKLRKVAITDDSGTHVVKGFECRGPGGSVEWPKPEVSDWAFDVRPTKIVWLAATPPLFAAAGKLTNPIGETSSAHRIFRACEPQAMDDVRWLGGGRWARLTMHWDQDQTATGSSWTIYVDDVAIATINASSATFEPAPP
jgi:hypothetical protein